MDKKKINWRINKSKQSVKLYIQRKEKERVVWLRKGAKAGNSMKKQVAMFLFAFNWKLNISDLTRDDPNGSFISFSFDS